MIDFLDNTLRHLFVSRIAELTSETQVRFQPPDEKWREYVTTLADTALNVYLIEMRENRKLRSNERAREINNGIASETPAPNRIDCHYLITAWSPASVTQSIEPTVDEHALLYGVTAVLMQAQPLVPSAIYLPDPMPGGFPEIIKDAELPTTVLPVEGFSKLAEFWGTMGATHPWKPAVFLTVTLPVVLQTEIAGPMVTTRITEYRQGQRPETAEVWIQIGGTVTDSLAQPLADAWVQIETMAGVPIQQTETNELGRFTFTRLGAGNYRLRVRSIGLGEKTRDVEVPSPSGEYDLKF